MEPPKKNKQPTPFDVLSFISMCDTLATTLRDLTSSSNSTIPSSEDTLMQHIMSNNLKLIFFGSVRSQVSCLAPCFLSPSSCLCLLPPVSFLLPPVSFLLFPSSCLLPPVSFLVPPYLCLFTPASSLLPPYLQLTYNYRPTLIFYA